MIIMMTVDLMIRFSLTFALANSLQSKLEKLSDEKARAAAAAAAGSKSASKQAIIACTMFVHSSLLVFLIFRTGQRARRGDWQYDVRAPHLNRFYLSNLGLGRYLLNLVQDNRKGIEAAAQQWRDGSKTDSDFIKVLEVTPQAAAASPASLTAARHAVLRWRRPRRASGCRTGPYLAFKLLSCSDCDAN
jgi:hypothetical protein